MANIGTQTTKNEAGGPYAYANVFRFVYPAKAVYPGGAGNQYTFVGDAGGGGISVYNRTT